MYAFPIVEVNVTTEEELLAMIHHGINVRTTAGLYFVASIGRPLDIIVSCI